MTPPNPAQEMFDLWRKSLEEGTQTWLKMMGQAAPGPPAPPPFPGSLPPLDVTALWRPLLTQGLEIWQKAAAEGALTPEFVSQWKNLMNQSIETWSKALEQAMGTEAFAQALGRYLDQWLVAQPPLRKGLEQVNDTALRTLGLPSRAQVVGLASQVVALEERIEGIEDRLGEIRNLLRDVLGALVDHGATTGRARPGTPMPPSPPAPGAS
jgi:hypothetical protein